MLWSGALMDKSQRGRGCWPSLVRGVDRRRSGSDWATALARDHQGAASGVEEQ